MTENEFGYKLREIAIEAVSASDLRDEAISFGDCRAYVVTIYGDDGPRAEAVDLVMFGTDRAGIAWGGDAVWTDCASPEDAIERYLGIDDKAMID